ncbi:hypothetical protein [Vibrio phage RYC]|nr:hypothetical protein [Vibrio phage RYC]
MKDNLKLILEMLFEKCKGRSKKFYAILSVILLSVVFALYTFVPRTPNMIGCTWDAKVKYSLISERWRFNWLMTNEDPEQCQRLNNKGDWMPMDKVSDSGSDE